MIIEIAAVSKRIDLLRKQNGLSQEQLARHLEVSQPAISTYLRDRLPPADTLYKIAQLGQTTVEWLLTGQKSYAFGNQNKAQVREKESNYDADWLLAQKIAALPDGVKEAVILLITQLTKRVPTIGDSE